jgi:hypothetical protein
MEEVPACPDGVLSGGASNGIAAGGIGGGARGGGHLSRDGARNYLQGGPTEHFFCIEGAIWVI